MNTSSIISVAIQMDEIAKINFTLDTSVRLAWEAKRRSFKLYYYTPKDLLLENGKVFAHLSTLDVTPGDLKHFEIKYFGKVCLEEINIILVRQDPPFDMPYLTSTYILEKLPSITLIVNNPTEIRNCPEKLLVCNFPELMPPTLISSNKEDIAGFLKTHKTIVLKPLYSFGGRDVFILKEDDANFQSIYEHLTNNYNDLIIAQKFIEDLKYGDKRIIMIDGTPSYALARIPGENQIRANIASGGKAIKTELTDRDKEICATIGPELKKRGLILAGIDIIGNYITEINITSPTGIALLNQLYNKTIEEDIFDAILKRCKL
jgi:glutathione synthase